MFAASLTETSMSMSEFESLRLLEGTAAPTPTLLKPYCSKPLFLSITRVAGLLY